METMNKINIFSNLKNIKTNYKVVKNSPYKSLVLKYKMTKGMSIVMGLIVVWRLITTGISFSQGNGWMGLINGAVITIIGVWFIKSLRDNLKKIKNRMIYYEKHGDKMQGSYDTNVDIKSEINDLIKTMKDKEVAKNG
jgi:cytochrome c biogenesis protein CcdA